MIMVKNFIKKKKKKKKIKIFFFIKNKYDYGKKFY